MKPSATMAPEVSMNQLQKKFTRILPRIRSHAFFSFRHVSCSDKREDLVCDAIAVCWKWFVQLAGRGKDATRFVTSLATFAVNAVRSGRRVYGQESSKDVLSGVAQRKGEFAVYHFQEPAAAHDGSCWESVRADTQTPVPDQVAFLQDFPAWLQTQTSRDREMINWMLQGEGTNSLARKFGVSSSRVAQLRREFRDDFRDFCAGPIDC